MFALELQEIVVATFVAVRIDPADGGAGGVDGALALVAVEEAADGLVDVILVVPEDLLVGVLRLVAVRVALLRDGDGHAEVLGQSLDVLVLHLDAGMAAAVAGALGTIESHSGEPLSPIRRRGL